MEIDQALAGSASQQTVAGGKDGEPIIGEDMDIEHRGSQQAPVPPLEE